MNKQLLTWGGLAILLGVSIAMVLPQAQANAPSAVKPIAQVPDAPFQLAQAPAGGKADWMKMVTSPDAAMVEKGKAAFAQCGACHGMTGKGDGAPLTPKPRNFHAKDGWKNGRDLLSVYKTLEEGIPGGPMQSYKHLPATERLAIIHYIRTFTDYPPITKEQAMEMDKKFGLAAALSQGDAKKQPIAVGVAMDKLVEEYAPSLEQVDAQLADIRVQASHQTKGALLFWANTYDPKRALVMLHNSDLWKKNLNEFKMVVTAALNNNGFGASMATLNKDEWNTLYQFLTKM